VFGAGQYAMRLWVKPDQLAKLGITVPEIVNAIQTQNTVNPAGKIGGEPIPSGQQFSYAVRAQGRLISPEEFGEIVVRESPEGGVVRVRDVARIELGAQDYSVAGRLNGKPSAIVAVYQLPGSNAVNAANGVNKLMGELKSRFPGDMDYTTALDTTRSVVQGIKEIILTLFIAIVLVILVVYLFLQGWRATLIPLLAVPVSLVGAFVFFPLFGFSINTLSLFGLVLAIGLVVDDAIVVVEAVERHIEDGMSPKDAALKAMEEISGALVGIALVLSAVFVPTAFIPGITGRLYQQFAITIALSVLLSAFNALTLSPALAALILQPREKRGGLLRSFFDWFNNIFERTTKGYVRICGALIRKAVVAIVLLAIFGAGAAFFSYKVPSSFLPDEDQGYLYVNLQLPSAASLERTDRVVQKIKLDAGSLDLAAKATTLKNWMPTSETTTFWLTPNPFGESFAQLSYLIHYPYGCIEQTTSSTRPLLYIANLVEQVDPKLAELRIEDMVLSGISRVFSMQAPDGGFGYWPGATESLEWATAYATHMLLDAKKAGYAVPQDRLNEVLGWIENRVAQYEHGQHVERDKWNHYDEQSEAETPVQEDLHLSIAE